jgi:hypothetical protein
MRAELAAADPEVMVDVRTAETLAAAELAQTLSRERPQRVLVAECQSHFQAQLVVDLAVREMTVIVAAERHAFLALVDDVATARKYIDGPH